MSCFSSCFPFLSDTKPLSDGTATSLIGTEVTMVCSLCKILFCRLIQSEMVSFLEWWWCRNGIIGGKFWQCWKNLWGYDSTCQMYSSYEAILIGQHLRPNRSYSFLSSAIRKFEVWARANTGIIEQGAGTRGPKPLEPDGIIPFKYSTFIFLFLEQMQGDSDSLLRFQGGNPTWFDLSRT